MTRRDALRAAPAAALALLVPAGRTCRAGDDGDARPRLEPVPGYRPARGDEARLYLRRGSGARELLDVHLARDFLAVEDYRKFVIARDREGVAAMRKAGRLTELASGTRVRVLDVHDFGALDREYEYRYVELRVLEGEARGRTFWALAESVRQCRVVYPTRRRAR